jgi:hypothetical protein
MTDARDNRRDARRLWVWPVAVLVSFPIGGYLADLVVAETSSQGGVRIPRIGQSLCLAEFKSGRVVYEQLVTVSQTLRLTSALPAATDGPHA